MLRSMFAGVSGLRSHQTYMDVVGNNISNVNTAGYKSGVHQFSDLLSQMAQGGAAPGVAGGRNPAQVGLGVKSAGVTQSFTQGAFQTTGRTTDLALSGDGFFAMEGAGGEVLYSRSGNFTLDAANNLVGEGGIVLDDAGNTVNINVAALKSYSIGPDGTITGVNNAGVNVALGRIGVAQITNPAGLEKAGGTLFRASANSGVPVIGVANTPGRGTMTSGVLEMSNVDLAQEFTNLITAQRGFQANSRIITASDEILQDLVNMKR